jgi:hypothetical protein
MAPPSRKHSSRLFSFLSFAFFLFIALIFLCPPAVSAQDKKSEYGTVIGIGTSFFLFLSLLFLSLMWFIFRLGNNVRGVHRALILTLLTSFFICYKVIRVLRACLVSDLWICPLSDSFSLPFFSVQRGGRVEIIANDQGHRITPSWVAFTDEERLYALSFFSPYLPPRAYPETRIGDSAKNAFHSNPVNTVFDAKRLIGRKIEEPELQRDLKHWWVRFSCLVRFGLIYF